MRGFVYALLLWLCAGVTLADVQGDRQQFIARFVEKDVLRSLSMEQGHARLVVGSRFFDASDAESMETVVRIAFKYLRDEHGAVLMQLVDSAGTPVGTYTLDGGLQLIRR